MWVNDVPAMGMKKLLILKEDNNKGKKNKVKTSSASFENKFYRIEIDKNTGGISVLFDKQLNKNLTDNNCKWKPGQLIYETLKNRGDYSSKSIKRTSVKNVKISPIENSSLWKSVKISADADGFVSEEKGAAGIQFEIRLYNFTKRIDFIYDVRKAEVTNPEAVYVAFPFNMPGFRIAYEAQGGSVAPGIDQLPGSASDWHTVQNYALLRNDNEQIVIGCNEAPLMEFGGLNLGKYQYIEKVNKPYIFSYVMNNYWHTNFRASQRGEIKWSYYFTSGKDTGEAAASKFGWSSRIPLAGSAIEAGNCKNSFHGKSLLNIENDNILLIGSSPSDNGKNLILHLREIAGKGSVVKLNGVKIKSADLVDVLGEVTEKNLAEIKIKPYESIFVRLNLQK